MPGLLSLFIDYTLPSACTTACASIGCFLTYVPHCCFVLLDTSTRNRQSANNSEGDSISPLQFSLINYSDMILQVDPFLCLFISYLCLCSYRSTPGSDRSTTTHDNVRKRLYANIESDHQVCCYSPDIHIDCHQRINLSFLLYTSQLFIPSLSITLSPYLFKQIQQAMPEPHGSHNRTEDSGKKQRSALSADMAKKM